MWMPWPTAVWCALALGAVSIALPGSVVHRRARVRLPLRDHARLAAVRPWLHEGAIVFVLYAAWRLLGEVEVMGTGGAMQRARDLWDLQRTLRLPNELTLQRWALKAPVFVRFGNWYYIVVHVIPVGVFLAWLFARHRDVYARWRTTFALSSLVVSLLQWVPLAPPRFFPELGFVDTGVLYGPRVYDDAGAGTAGQLSAMPSMHVAWAVAIGLAVFVCAKSRWRWLGPAHAVLTQYAVCVTGYHWFADGLVAALAVFATAWATGRWYGRRDRAATPERATPLERRSPPPHRSDVPASG